MTSSARTAMPALVSSSAICTRVRVVVLVRYEHAIWLSDNVRNVLDAPSIGFHDVTRTPSMSNSTPPIAIGSQGRGVRSAGPFPHPPFNPCVRFSRTRLNDDLLDMVTQPSGSG